MVSSRSSNWQRERRILPVPVVLADHVASGEQRRDRRRLDVSAPRTRGRRARRAARRRARARRTSTDPSSSVSRARRRPRRRACRGCPRRRGRRMVRCPRRRGRRMVSSSAASRSPDGCGRPRRRDRRTTRGRPRRRGVVGRLAVVRHRAPSSVSSMTSALPGAPSALPGACLVCCQARRLVCCQARRLVWRGGVAVVERIAVVGVVRFVGCLVRHLAAIGVVVIHQTSVVATVRPPAWASARGARVHGSAIGGQFRFSPGATRVSFVFAWGTCVTSARSAHRPRTWTFDRGSRKSGEKCPRATERCSGLSTQRIVPRRRHGRQRPRQGDKPP